MLRLSRPLRWPAWVALASSLLLAGCATQAPVITAVDAWGGSASATPLPPQRIERITLHHQGEIWNDSADVAAYLRRLQQWSRITKAWRDIPYHYVIGPDGRIYAARPVAEPGDTNTGYDTRGHALVMLVGNFEVQQPTPAQLQAATTLVAWLAREHRVPMEHINSHRDFSPQTLCPGKHLLAYLESGDFKRAVAARLARP